MHTPRFFSHGDDSLTRGLGRGEVDVSHFRDALRTASSIAPWLISPPSMCAMGMRSASATEAGASIS